MNRNRWPLLLAFFCLGADQCPIAVSDGTSTDQSPTSDQDTLDIGGSQGALWSVTFDPELLVTLRAGQETVSQTVSLQEGLLELQGQILDVAGFCWRTDTLCPNQVLPQETGIIQQSSAPQQVLIGFNRRGPLASLGQYTGLVGQLDGSSLSVPLAVGPAAEGQCGLAPTSELIAIAFTQEDGGRSATTIQGRVALAYSGLCFNLGSSGAVDNSLLIELSMKFTAERQP